MDKHLGQNENHTFNVSLRKRTAEPTSKASKLMILLISNGSHMGKIKEVDDKKHNNLNKRKISRI